MIEDTVNKKFETGIGSVASNVLTRTKPQVTWDGTTYVDNAPTALQFGSSPASGNIKVRLSATADATFNSSSRNNTVTSGDAWTYYKYYSTQNANGQEHNITAGNEYYNVYQLEQAGRLTGMQFEVTTAVAGSLKMALYALGSAGLPSQKIVDFNTTSINSTGIKTDTTTSTWSPAGTPWLTPGWYAIGFISDVGAKIRGLNLGQRGTLDTPFGRRGYYGACSALTIAGNYATGLPAIPSLGSATTIDPGAHGDRMRIGLRIVQ